MTKKRSTKESATIIIFWIILAIMIFYAASNIAGLKTADNSSNPQPQATSEPSQSPESMITTYKNILEDNPENLKALVGLGDLYYDNRRYHDAIAIFLRAEKVNPANVHIENDLGLLYLSTGSYDDAIVKFNKALEVNPSHLESLYYIGVAYLQKNDNAMAQQTFERLLASNPPAQLAKKTQQELDLIKNSAASQ